MPKKKCICPNCENNFEAYDKRFCSHECYSEWLKGKVSKKLNKGKGTINHDGYRKIRLNNKTISEHHLVWCSQEFNLPYIPKGFTIHHIDGNKVNNQINNLILLNNSDHVKLHWMRGDLRCR